MSSTRRVNIEVGVEWVLFLCASLSIFVTIGILLVLAFETFQFFQTVSPLEFLFGTTWTPLFFDQQFGVLPLVAGTALVSTVAMLVAVPAGLLTAIYLSEYAPTSVRRVVKPILEVLSGVPTVVYGYFALLFVTPLLQNIVTGLSGFKA